MSEHTLAGESLLRTPLYEEHVRLGARMAPFGGWEMPIDYGSIIAEHQATRQAAGLFDLSHMGEFMVEGDGAPELLSVLLTNNPAALAPGQGLYSPMCRDDGTIVDDVIVYRLPEPQALRYLLVVNAANIAKDWAWLSKVREEERSAAVPEDRSGEIALIAIQGPRAEAILQSLVAEPLQALGSFGIHDTAVGGLPCLVARTGYTGEDGFEIFTDNGFALDLWHLLMERGRSEGLRPVGLGARDTLRLEARLPLYGNDIDDTTTPLEAGLGRWVKLEKPAFRGREALLRQQEAGPVRRLVGLTMDDRSIARAHYPVCDREGRHIGVVTSGSFTPTIGRGIALAYVPGASTAVGTKLQVLVRGQAHPATVVKTPFYRRPKA